MKKLSILLLVTIFTISCNSKKKTAETPTQNTNRVWMLVAFKDYKKEFLVEKNAYLDMTDSERASAKMGCNAISFTYSIKEENAIEFTQGIATKMYCQDNMLLEDAFLKEIPLVEKYNIDGHTLTLTSKTGEKMVFVAQDWD